MEKLNIGEKLNFENVDLTAPNVVLEHFSKQISDETNNIICGNVINYDGAIMSSHKSIVPSIKLALEQTVDVQESLGKIGDVTNKFEFYLSTPSFENYKYRICFLEFGVANYPVSVVLEQSIADSINLQANSNYVVKCDNNEEFKELVFKVISSKRVIEVMQELIYINQINKNSEINM